MPCIGRQILDYWTTREVLGSHTLRIAIPDKAGLLQILDSVAWKLKRSVQMDPQLHPNSFAGHRTPLRTSALETHVGYVRWVADRKRTGIDRRFQGRPEAGSEEETG